MRLEFWSLLLQENSVNHTGYSNQVTRTRWLCRRSNLTFKHITLFHNLSQYCLFLKILRDFMPVRCPLLAGRAHEEKVHCSMASVEDLLTRVWSAFTLWPLDWECRNPSDMWIYFEGEVLYAYYYYYSLNEDVIGMT